MSKPSKKLATLVIVIISVGAILGVKFFLKSSRSDLKISSSSKLKGDPKAPFQITEFIDFECPMCADGAKYLNEIMDKYPKAIHLEIKYYPLTNHRHSFSSAMYAECAARQGKFWPFYDYLFKRQDSWKQLINAKPAFEIIAQEVHLDSKQLETCLSDESVMDDILKNKSEGSALGVKSTPSYFINGEMVVGINTFIPKLNQLLTSL